MSHTSVSKKPFCPPLFTPVLNKPSVADLPEGDNVIILTASRLLSIQSKRLRLNWELPFTSVQTVTIEDNGIRFAHKMGKGHDRFIYIPDKSSQSWFFNQVATVVKDFNVRKRMD
jgi:vacuolar protein sorting-associated protein 13A/C